MESLVLFLFAVAGATFIVVFSSLFEPVRKLFWIDEETIDAVKTNQIRKTFKMRVKSFLGSLIQCPLCFGFWMGAVMFLFIYGIEDYNGLIHFAFSCAGSASSYLFYHIIKE